MKRNIQMKDAKKKTGMKKESCIERQDTTDTELMITWLRIFLLLHYLLGQNALPVSLSSSCNGS